MRFMPDRKQRRASATAKISIDHQHADRMYRGTAEEGGESTYVSTYAYYGLVQ